MDGLGFRVLNSQVEGYLRELKRRTIRRGECESPVGAECWRYPFTLMVSSLERGRPSQRSTSKSLVASQVARLVYGMVRRRVQFSLPGYRISHEVGLVAPYRMTARR